MKSAKAAALLLAAAPLAASAGEVPGALVTLEVLPAAVPGRVAAAAPMRFALLEKGQVFVGGSSRIAAGVLEGDERKQLEKRIERVAKQNGLGGELRLGPGDTRYRLHFPQRRVLVLALGEPEAAFGENARLGELIAELRDFDHGSLLPWRPARYLLSVAQRRLPGGCREWRLELDPRSLLRQPLAIPAGAVPDWPTGSLPTSVCVGVDRYAVTLRPLVPGES